MPNIKSAKKRVEVINKKNLENRMIRSKVSSYIKKLNVAVEDNDMTLVDKLLPEVVAVIDKAVAQGVLHPNNAARKKSNIQTRINGVKSGEIVIVKKLDNKTIAAQKAKAAKDAREAVRAEAKAKAEAKAAEKAALDPKAKKPKAKKDAAPVKEKVTKDKPAKEVKEAKPKAPKAKKEAVSEDKSAE